MKKTLTRFGWPLLLLPILLMLLGFACNQTAVLANGGVMPVYSKAYDEDQGYKSIKEQYDMVVKHTFPDEPDFLHESATKQTKFHYLCDIFPTDGGIESIGDIVIYIADTIQLPAFGIWLLAAVYCWRKDKPFNL